MVQRNTVDRHYAAWPGSNGTALSARVVFQNCWRQLHDGTNLHCGYPGGEAGSDRRIIAGIQFASRRDNLVSIVSSSKS
jgi:hypothetical protein